MSLKDIIRRSQLIKMFGHKMELTLPGEPMIYSVKERLMNRIDTADHFRNRQFIPRIRCEFPSYAYKQVPVVLIIAFYVTPFAFAGVPEKLVRSEAPALHAYEIAEYLLSFMEMLSKVLVGSYRQIVKIDAEKYYSNEPRTVFKFMSWSNYERLLQGSDPIDTNTEAKRPPFKRKLVQPKCSGDAGSAGTCVQGSRPQ